MPKRSSAPPSYLNAYYDGNHAVFVGRREDGSLRLRRMDSRPVAWMRRGERKGMDRELEQVLRQDKGVHSIAHEDGGWVRITFRDHKSANDILKGLEEHGGYETFEGDISGIRRIVAEHRVQIAEPRRVYLDIETDSRKTFDEARNGKARVLAWCLCTDEGVHKVGLLRQDTDDDEERLLRALWKHLDPFDQVLAWNGDGFDFPIIQMRARRHGIRHNAKRFLWLDQMLLFQRMNTMAARSGDEKTSLKLDDVAQSLLGYGKNDFDASKTWEAWAESEQKRIEMVRYMIQDTKLLADIEKETGYADLLQALCEVTGAFPDTRGMKPSGQVENYLLRVARDRGHKFRTNRRRRESSEQFLGAFVMQPTVEGIGHNIHVADFSAMYPSIIISWNMSLETKFTPPLGAPVGDGYCRSSTGVSFRTTEAGILPAAISEIMKLRAFSKKKMKEFPPGSDDWAKWNRRSTAYKIAVNSFYGVIGSPLARFFDRELAESVTQCGVYLIKKTMEAAEARGWSVVYGDSVTGDRVLVVRDPTGDVRMMKAEEIWGQTAPLDCADLKEVGVLRGWSALARDEGGLEGWFPIECVKRHRSGKKTWRLTTKHGQTHVTEDHGIMCGGKETRPEEMVEKGLKFDVVSAPVEEPFETLDLLGYLSEFEHTYEYKGRTVTRAFEGDDEYVWLAGWGKKQPRFRRFYERGSDELHALLRLVFAYVSDGSASLRLPGAGYMLSFCKRDRALQDQLAADLRLISSEMNVFGPYETAGTLVVRSGTAGAACLFAALCGRGSGNKTLPPFVFRLDDSGFEVAFQALVNGDGYLDSAGQLKFTTTSAKLASSTSFLLSQHGVEHGWDYRPEKAAWTLRTRPSGSEHSRYSIKAETFDGRSDEWVYDLTVRGAHTFVDGVGRVLLHNTDSLFVGGCTEEAFAEFVQWCNAELYPRLLRELGCKDNHIELGYEKAFDRIVFTSAKRYSGRYLHYEGVRGTEQSKPEVKGLEFKRGDSLRLARQFQEEVVHAVVGYQCPGADDPSEIVEIVNRWKNRILVGELELDEVMISKRLSKPLDGKDAYKQKTKKDGTSARQPPHVEIARQMASRGEDVRVGSRVSYICVDASKSPKQFAEAPRDAYDSDGNLRVDRHGIWEDFVWPPTKRFLEAAFPSYDWTPWDKTRPKTPQKRGPRAPKEQEILPGL